MNFSTRFFVYATCAACFASLGLVACGDDGTSSGDDSSVIFEEDSSDSSSDDSSSSKKIGKSSSSTKSSSSEKKSSSSFVYEQDSTAFEKDEVVAIKNKNVVGKSQKGPVANGSAFNVYELDCETFKKTDKKFEGKVVTGDGQFAVSGVNLGCQFAMLEANGKYLNEVTGKTSNEAITLKGIVDLDKNDKANINLLTHLEYDRVVYLLGKGLNFAAAKKQADAEILNAFGIVNDSADFDKLDIFGKGDGDAALLAVSILMQGDWDEKELSDLMEKFASDFKKDGEWNDEESKSKIADWARKTDLDSNLQTIRVKIKSWNYGVAPKFEPYIRNFWNTFYGIGACDEENENVVAAVTNKNCSEYDTEVRYICKSGQWNVATTFEKDTYLWEPGEDGDSKQGNVTHKVYIYDEVQKTWRSASYVEKELGGCSKKREADLSSNTGMRDGSWYVCKDRDWELTDVLFVDTQGWEKGSDGEFKKGDSTDAWYSYDEIRDTWSVVSRIDTILNFACTQKRVGEVKLAGNQYYTCTGPDKKSDNCGWNTSTKIEYDTYGEKCTETEVGKVVYGVVEKKERYYCSANGWLDVSDGTSNLEIPNVLHLNPDIEYGTITDERDGQIYRTVEIAKGGYKQVWMAENLKYADSVNTSSLIKNCWCYEDNESYCAVFGRLYSWTAAVDSVALANDPTNPQECSIKKVCDRVSLDEVENNPIQGICPSGWHLPSRYEWRALMDVIDEEVTSVKWRSKTGWNRDPGTDDYGFSVLIAGQKYNVATGMDAFEMLGHTYFWSSTLDVLAINVEPTMVYSESRDEYWLERNAVILQTEINKGRIGSFGNAEKEGFSIRCIKNSEP